MTAADLDRVEASVADGLTLPGSWYLERELYELEREAIFKRTWQYACHASAVADPGDYAVCPVGDFTVLVARDDDGRLRAFHNTCQHRGSELAAGSGNGKALRCAYHGWTYGLDGVLRSAPRLRGAPGFDPSEIRLPEIRLDAWEQFLFVNCDLDAPPLADRLGDLARMVAAFPLDYRALEHDERITYDVAANWKIVVENSVECYHCHIAHPELVDLVDMKRFEQETLPYGFVQRSPLADEGERRTEDGAAYDYPAGAVREGGYHFFWPNFYFLVYPGPGNVSSMCFYPRGVDRTEVVRDFYYAPSVPAEERREITAFIDTIQRQDSGLCAGVQRGLRGGGFTQGRLQLHDHLGEYGPHLHQQLVVRHLREYVGAAA
jgi:choline monooxygenase